MLTYAFQILRRINPAYEEAFGQVIGRLWLRYWYHMLASRYQLPEWQMMNYGYAPSTIPLSPEDENERYGFQMYQHVAGAVDLAGKEVLEVGCGRGGGAAYLCKTMHPAAYTAVDLSAAAIALCRKRYPLAGLKFQVGNAQQLPFADARFDAVVNIESSHNYPSDETFFREIRRVLRPHGYFLYADFRRANDVEPWFVKLRNAGLIPLVTTNILANVLGALDADHERKQALIQKIALPERNRVYLEHFAAMKDSSTYEQFSSGKLQYYSFVMQREA